MDLENGKEFIQLKKTIFFGNFGKFSDIEKANGEKFIFEDKEVYRIVKDTGRIRYVWNDKWVFYEVSGSVEEKTILKFIENIKILKNF